MSILKLFLRNTYIIRVALLVHLDSWVHSNLSWCSEHSLAVTVAHLVKAACVGNGRWCSVWVLMLCKRLSRIKVGTWLILCHSLQLLLKHHAASHLLRKSSIFAGAWNRGGLVVERQLLSGSVLIHFRLLNEVLWEHMLHYNWLDLGVHQIGGLLLVLGWWFFHLFESGHNFWILVLK